MASHHLRARKDKLGKIFFFLMGLKNILSFTKSQIETGFEKWELLKSGRWGRSDEHEDEQKEYAETSNQKYFQQSNYCGHHSI